MSSQAIPLLTPEQYLEIERKAECKSEYWNGEMFAMAGASETHNELVHNTGRHAGTKLLSEPCRVYQKAICGFACWRPA